MNAERLLQHFASIESAPDAIPRLRQFILDLAVRGKLVPQNTNDKPASELLKRIAIEKTRLSKSEKLRPLKCVPPFADDDPPFLLPVGWQWSQLAEVGILNPRNEAADEVQASFVPMSLIPAEYGVANDHEVRQWGEIKKGYTHFAEGDVGLAKITPCFENGKSTVFRKLTGGLGSGTTELHIVRPLFVDPNYIVVYLKSPTFIEGGIPKMTGTAGQKRVPTEYFALSPFPLPPLAEQHRIVTKVDELMTLCDELEDAKIEREAARDRLVTASLARITQRDNEQNYKAGVRFALGNLPALTAVPHHIKQLRQTILDLAVSGKLSTEGDACTTLTKLGEVASLQNGYAFKSEWFSKTGTRLLRNANVGHGVLNWEEEVRLPANRQPEYERFRLREGDIVLSLDRPFIATGTKVARVKASDLPALLLQRVGRFVLSPALSPDYLFLWIHSPHFAAQIDPGRSNGVPHISSKQVEAAVLFLPSLAEQNRIVAQVKQLMVLCDRLETEIDKGRETARRFLEGVLHEALTPLPVHALEAAQ